MRPRVYRRPSRTAYLTRDGDHELASHHSDRAAVRVAVQRDADDRFLLEPSAATTSGGTSMPVAVLPLWTIAAVNFMLVVSLLPLAHSRLLGLLTSLCNSSKALRIASGASFWRDS